MNYDYLNQDGLRLVLFFIMKEVASFTQSHRYCFVITQPRIETEEKRIFMRYRKKYLTPFNFRTPLILGRKSLAFFWVAENLRVQNFSKTPL